MSPTHKILGCLLSGLMLLLAAWGFFVFKVFLKASFLQWVMYNVCAPTEILFFALVMLVCKKPEYAQYLLIPVIPLVVFGTMGLFIFPWSGQGALISQLSHLLMTISALWVIYINRNLDAVNLKVIYWIYGVSILIAVQNWYCRATADTLRKMLNI